MGNTIPSANQARSDYQDNERRRRSRYESLRQVRPALGGELTLRRQAENHAFNSISTDLLSDSWSDGKDRRMLAVLMAYTFSSRYHSSADWEGAHSLKLIETLEHYFEQLLRSPTRRPPGVRGSASYVEVDEFGRGPRIGGAHASLPSQVRQRFVCH